MTSEKGTNTIFVIIHEEIVNIPRNKVIIYARVVLDYREQKEDPYRVRITAGGNLIKCNMELTTRTADILTSKILWNGVISTKGATYSTFDIKKFYLGTPPSDYEYMRMPLKLFPDHIIEQYNLKALAKNGFVYVEIRKAIYGLPQAGKLANKQLTEFLEPHGYYEVEHTPGLWGHKTRPIQFTLVVDDFGVKYIGKEHADHLLSILEYHYPTVAKDWKGELYCGITLKWNYAEGYVDISMPGYIKRLLLKYKHKKPTKPQYSPYPIQPRKFGKAAQEPMPEDKTQKADEEKKKRVQRVVGSILYYGKEVDMTTLPSLSTLASEQAKASEQTIMNMEHLLE